MSSPKVRVAAVACVLAALFLAPSPSEAGLCDWLFPTASPAPAPAATTYAPPYTAQRVSLMPVVGTAYTAYSPTTSTVCSPVGQTCYYTPQTTYRWSYSRIERTSYRPVTAVDPCTGCPTTTYQAVTRKSLLPWLHRKPVTSYRLTSTPTSVCSPVCGSACSVSCPAPSVSSGVITSSGASCPAGCVPATGPISSSPQPDPGYGGAPKTFETPESSGSASQGAQSSSYRLPPRSEAPGSSEPPRLIDPENRSAAKPIRYATYRHTSEAPAERPALDVSGWRASRD